MSINPAHLRIGNWIHCKGSSHYGVVTGDILAEMERDEKFRDKFQYIELTDELLETAGFIKDRNGFALPDKMSLSFSITRHGEYLPCWLDKVLFPNGQRVVQYVHELQNLYFCLTGSELPLPESAKIIPQAIER